MKNNISEYPIVILIIAAALCLTIRCGRMNATPEVTVTLNNGDTVRRISIVLGGDVMQHMPQVMAARHDSGYDYTETFRYLKPFLDTVDLAVVNLETTIGESGRYSGYPMFSSPPELLTAMKECGVDAVTLANNHMMDKGLRGIAATINTLDKAGLRHTGVFGDSARLRTDNPLILEARGMRIALFNYTYGLNGLPVPKGAAVNLIDTAHISADLAGIDRATIDLIIIYFHWGYEYVSKPSNRQKELARWCRDKGVDIVAGAHPHVLQPIETHTGASEGFINGVTAYSLGNLVSNQRGRYTDGGMLLKLDVERRGHRPPTVRASYILTWTHTPVIDGRRRYIILPSPVADTLLEGDPAERAYRVFERDSRSLLGGDSILREIRADPALLWERALKSSALRRMN